MLHLLRNSMSARCDRKARRGAALESGCTRQPNAARGRSALRREHCGRVVGSGRDCWRWRAGRAVPVGDGLTACCRACTPLNCWRLCRRRGRDASAACGCVAADRARVDHSRGRRHRLQPAAGRSRSRWRRLPPRFRPRRSSRSCCWAWCTGRRARRGLHRPDAAGHAVVHPVQRDRRRHGHSHRTARSRASCFRFSRAGSAGAR